MPIPSTITDDTLMAANRTLALYYQLFFARHQRLSTRTDHFVAAFMEMLPQRQVTATTDTGHPRIHILVADCIPLRILMTRWIPEEEEQRLLRAMQRQAWPIGLLLNFGAPNPQLRRFFLNQPP